MDWYQIELPVDDDLPGRSERVTEQFGALFTAAGYPNGMALFASRPSPESVAFYFSPTAARFAEEVIQQFDGHACQRPRADTVELVEGFEHDRERLCAP